MGGEAGVLVFGSVGGVLDGDVGDVGLKGVGEIGGVGRRQHCTLLEASPI